MGDTTVDGRRRGAGFKGMLAWVVILALAGLAAWLASERNARSWYLVPDDGRLVVMRGLMLPAGRAAYTPSDPSLAQAYAPLVPVGSYVVVTDTIVNGHPVWPAFGPGPTEAVKQILSSHGEFVSDSRMEKYSLTFNPGGFLHRVR